MRVFVLQHVAFEGLAAIKHWLDSKAAQVTIIRLFANDKLPLIAEVDFLIVLGGPMSVNDPDLWIQDELRFIQAYLQSQKPVLGVCLGAQFLAKALGGEVSTASAKEIGWFPIHSTQRNGNHFQFPETLTVMHWHGETFSLPTDAIHTASSEGCSNQSFQFGRRAIGLQFHLEMDQSSAQAMIENCEHELVEGPYIQNAQTILEGVEHHSPRANETLTALLDYLVAA